MMQPDGVQKAIEVHIFPESMRGTGEGHYDWDLLLQEVMTNATSSRLSPASMGKCCRSAQGWREEALGHAGDYCGDLMKWARRRKCSRARSKIFVAAAKKQPDGTVQAPRITYGRNGQAPAF